MSEVQKSISGQVRRSKGEVTEVQLGLQFAVTVHSDSDSVVRQPAVRHGGFTQPETYQLALNSVQATQPFHLAEEKGARAQSRQEQATFYARCKGYTM